MTDFSNFSALRIKEDTTAEFVFDEIEGEPTLTCRPATQENEDFFNAVLAKNKTAKRKKSKSGTVPTAQLLKEARASDIEVFVDFIIVSWVNVLDAKGKAVPFSKEDCVLFLQAIPNDMFDSLRVFCLDIANFRPTMDEEELSDLSGN
jgi:hypothetical protein